MLRSEIDWLIARGERLGALDVTDEEIALVRANGRSLMESFRYPNTPDARQPAEFRDGQQLVRLADRLRAYQRARHAWLTGA